MAWRSARMNRKDDRLVERVERAQNLEPDARDRRCSRCGAPSPAGNGFVTPRRSRTSGGLDSPRSVAQFRTSSMTSPTTWTSCGDAFGGEVARRRVARAQQEVRQVIGDDPVDLLGHAAVEAAQPGLDVSDGHEQLRGRQRTGQRGVRIAVDQEPVRTFGDAARLRSPSASRRFARRALRNRRPG